MATNVQNASSIMDALADFRGKATLSAARKLEIAGAFAKDPAGSNDQKAGDFLDHLFSFVASVVRSRASNDALEAAQSTIEQAGDDAVSDL